MKFRLLLTFVAVLGFLFLSACMTSPSRNPVTIEAVGDRDPATEAQSKAAIKAEPEGIPNTVMSQADALLFAQWAQVDAPSQGETEIVGAYAAGCLSGAKRLPLESANYIVMKPSQRAYFGDSTLITYINQLAERAREAGLSPLMVEDLSRPRGGPVAKGHGSHQTGLDVDISFTFATRSYSAVERETFESPSFVNGRKTLSPDWTDAQTKLVSLGADLENVNRIFVSPAIKAFFCEKFPTASWLYKLRPWWGHDDHMHVRLDCPAGAKSCRKQAPLNPRQNSCGSEMEWWLSADADRQWNNIQEFWKTGQSKKFPKLPPRCTDVRSALD